MPTISNISDEQLSTVLWYGAKTYAARVLQDGTLWEHRPAPSAGGLHPIEILLTRSDGPFYHYNPLSHSIRASDHFTRIADIIRAHADSLFPWRKGVLLLFVGCFGKTGARYRNPESLVWRDAGALLCALAYAAAACGLHCVPLGATFDPVVSDSFASGTLVWGAGASVLGT